MNHTVGHKSCFNIEEAPCDNCDTADHCSTYKLACSEFLKYVNQREVRIRKTNRIPDGIIYQQIFHPLRGG